MSNDPFERKENFERHNTNEMYRESIAILEDMLSLPTERITAWTDDKFRIDNPTDTSLYVLAIWEVSNFMSIKEFFDKHEFFSENEGGSQEICEVVFMKGNIVAKTPHYAVNPKRIVISFKRKQ